MIAQDEIHWQQRPLWLLLDLCGILSTLGKCFTIKNFTPVFLFLFPFRLQLSNVSPVQHADFSKYPLLPLPTLHSSRRSDKYIHQTFQQFETLKQLSRCLRSTFSTKEETIITLSGTFHMCCFSTEIYLIHLDTRFFKLLGDIEMELFTSSKCPQQGKTTLQWTKLKSQLFIVELIIQGKLPAIVPALNRVLVHITPLSIFPCQTIPANTAPLLFSNFFEEKANCFFDVPSTQYQPQLPPLLSKTNYYSLHVH